MWIQKKNIKKEVWSRFWLNMFEYHPCNLVVGRYKLKWHGVAWFGIVLPCNTLKPQKQKSPPFHWLFQEMEFGTNGVQFIRRLWDQTIVYSKNQFKIRKWQKYSTLNLMKCFYLQNMKRETFLFYCPVGLHLTIGDFAVSDTIGQYFLERQWSTKLDKEAK